MSCAPTTTRENGGGQRDLMRSARSICSRFPMVNMTIPRCARAVRVLHFEPIEGRPRQPLRYRRFATAAEAIRFAVEELPGARAGRLDAGREPTLRQRRH